MTTAAAWPPCSPSTHLSSHHQEPSVRVQERDRRPERQRGLVRVTAWSQAYGSATPLPAPTEGPLLRMHLTVPASRSPRAMPAEPWASQLVCGTAPQWGAAPVQYPRARGMFPSRVQRQFFTLVLTPLFFPSGPGQPSDQPQAQGHGQTLALPTGGFPRGSRGQPRGFGS